MRSTPSIRQLRAFIAVYRCGQIAAAADQLALTPPAVTVLLRELETKLGVRLFDRTTRSLRRTAAATQAIAYAERALAELTSLGASMADLAQGRHGRLRIAATSTVAQTLLPAAIRRFTQHHPGIAIEIDDCAPGEFVERITSDHVDLGVGTLEAPLAGLEERIFLRDWLVAAAPADTGFVDGRAMTWKQLAGLPAITVRPGYGVRRRIEQAAAQAGVTLHVAHEVSLLTTALAMASAGLGVAVVPASIVPHTPGPALAMRKLVRPTAERPIAVIRRRDRAQTAAAAAFSAVLTG